MQQLEDRKHLQVIKEDNTTLNWAEFLKSEAGYVLCPVPSSNFFFENIGPGEDCFHLYEFSDEVKRHFNTFRFRCRNCSETFCASCKTFPYHLGSTCEDVTSITKRVFCRFCEKENLEDGKDLVCSDSNCKDCEIFAQQCRNKDDQTQCTHPCHYYSRYYSPTNCECLHPACNSNTNLDDNCCLCSEKLRRYPLVKLSCSHIFHAKCVEYRVASRWTTNNICLTYCRCPLCYKKISTHFGCIPNLNYGNALRADLKHRLPGVLENMGITVKPMISDDDYEDEALRKVNYYECFKCKSIYFGGLRECGQFDVPIENLLCNACVGSCSKHGSDYLIYKCKFCCCVANYFCFGHTHFCANCHPKAWDIVNANFYMCIKSPIEFCPKNGSCPLGNIPHPPSGEEFVIGCSACL